MKYIIPLLIGVFLFSGCKKDPDILFEMAYERDFTIPAGLNTFESHYFYLRDINVGSYLTSNNVTASDLAAINPGTARMSTIFPGLTNYSFIREVSIRLYTDDEEDYREVYWRTQITPNQGEDLDIFATLVDLRQYFESTKFNMIIKLNLQGVPQQTVETKFRFSFLAK